MLRSLMLPWRGYWVARFDGRVDEEGFHVTRSTPAVVYRGVTSILVPTPAAREARAFFLSELQFTHDHPMG